MDPALRRFYICRLHRAPGAILPCDGSDRMRPPPTPTSLARTLARQDDTLSPPPAEPQRRYTLHSHTLLHTLLRYSHGVERETGMWVEDSGRDRASGPQPK